MFELGIMKAEFWNTGHLFLFIPENPLCPIEKDSLLFVLIHDHLYKKKSKLFVLNQWNQ